MAQTIFTEPLNREERVALVMQAAKEFADPKQPGRILWKKAFETHPDWQTAFDARTKVKLNRHYVFASYALRKGGARKSLQGATAHVPPPAAPASNPSPSSSVYPKHAETARKLAMPWTAPELAKLSGQTAMAAMKSLADWLSKGWVRRLVPGKYEPTETFPVPAAAPINPAAPLPAKDLQAGEKLTAVERRALITKIGATYAAGKGGKINFKQAFEEHPEYKAALEGSNFYSVAKGLGFGRPMKKVTSGEEIEAAPAPQTIVQEGVNFCPHCGGSLVLFNKSMGALQQMAQEAATPAHANNGRRHGRN